jgi:spore germination protein KB
MGREIISEKEGIAISLLFIMNGTLILPSGAEAQKDIWIGIILATALGALISLVYIKILSSYPGKNLFDISEILFGRFIGKIISLLYVWFAFHLASLVFADFVHFIITVSLPEMRGLTIIIFPVILCLWGLKIGIEGIGRFSALLLTPLVLFIFIAYYLMIPKMSLDHFLPIFENGFLPIFNGAFSLFAFPFAETVIFMGIFNCFRENKSISRVYLISIILAGIIVLLAKASEVAVLGIDIFTQHYFPAYAAISRISVGHFIQRIEIVVGLVFAIGGLVKISVCMLFACKGISRILSFKDYRFLVTPMVMLNVAFTFITSDSIIQLTSFTLLAWRYYAFPFQVIIPSIMLILTLLKKNLHSFQINK